MGSIVRQFEGSQISNFSSKNIRLGKFGGNWRLQESLNFVQKEGPAMQNIPERQSKGLVFSPQF